MKLEGSKVADELLRRGYSFFTGVPCSHLDPVVSALLSRGATYVPAVNEGAALALAAGARLGGRRSALFVQNSGLGNLVNPLTSLVQTFSIPCLVFMSLRGWPDPTQDEPQHAVMGGATHTSLLAFGANTWTLQPTSPKTLELILDEAEGASERGESTFVLVPRGSFVSDSPSPEADVHPPGRLSRRGAVETIVRHAGDALILSSTGFTSRDLAAAGHRAENFYMQGSMGHVASLALGVALTTPGRRIIALDGDGALLMHMGCVTSICHERARNLLHVVLVNGTYDSTGGQPLPSGTVDWEQFGRTMGYRTTRQVDSANALDAATAELLAAEGPAFLAVRIEQRSEPAPRVTGEHQPLAISRSFAAAAAHNHHDD
jgi:phosphonopyruvate decarboxylase